LWMTEPAGEERTDLLQVVCCAKGGKTLLPHDGHVCFELCVTDDAVELLGDFVELLQLGAERVHFLFDGALEHVDGAAVFPR